MTDKFEQFKKTEQELDEKIEEIKKAPEPEIKELEIKNKEDLEIEKEQETNRIERVLNFGEIRKKIEKFEQAREELVLAEKKGKGIKEAQEKYEKMKAEYVGEKIWRDLKEQERMTETKAEEFKGLSRKFYEWSSNKYIAPKKLIEKIQNWQPETKKGKAGKILANLGLKFTSVRNITSYGLLGAGIAAGATGIGIGATFGTIALRRGLAGMGTGFGMYNTLNKIVDWRESKEDIHKELNEQELNNLSQKEIIDRLEYFEAKARVRGQKVKELSYYQNYRNLKLELNQRFKEKFEVKKEGEVEKQAGAVKSWLTKTRQQINENLNEHYEEEKTKDKKIKTAAVGAGVFTGLGGIRITGKGVFDLIKGKGTSGFVQAGSQEFNAYKTLFLGKEEINVNDLDTITSAAPKPEIADTTQLQKLKPQFETALADSELSDTTKTAIQDNLNSLPPEQQKYILSQIAKKDSLEKTFASTDTSQQVQKKIEELTGVKLETPKPEIIPEKIIPEKIVIPATESVVQKGEGVIHSLQRQLLADPEKFGYDKSSGLSPEDWAKAKANNIAFNKGYSETWVREPGKVAYVLEGDEKTGFNIKEINAQTGKEIGTSGKMDAHEMKPIEKPRVKPKIELDETAADKSSIRTPAVETSEFIENKPETPQDKIITQLENNFNNADITGKELSGWTPEIVKTDAIKTLEGYLTETDIKDLSGKLNQIQNTEILDRLADSDNEILSNAANEAKENLLTQGNAVERINNILELEKPDAQDLSKIKDIFQKIAETKLVDAGDNKQISALFSSYITQSPDFFEQTFGHGAVTQNEIQGAWVNFISRANMWQVPTNFEEWQPFSDSKGNIFNVLKHGKTGGAVEYWIDTTGNGKPDQAFTDLNQLKQVLMPGMETKIPTSTTGAETITEPEKIQTEPLEQIQTKEMSMDEIKKAHAEARATKLKK